MPSNIPWSFIYETLVLFSRVLFIKSSRLKNLDLFLSSTILSATPSPKFGITVSGGIIAPSAFKNLKGSDL